MALDATVLAGVVWGVLTLATCIGSGVALESYKASDRMWYMLGAAEVVGLLSVGYLVWAWRYHRLAADALARRLGPSGDGAWNRCSKCERSMAGLPPLDGKTVCPGCGEKYPFLGGAKLARAGCASCGYQLAGLENVRGLVVCPECGASNPAVG
jgi:DNA-directed RNA polymerase subunit RPC12/RpoP